MVAHYYRNMQPEYYSILRGCQALRPNENISDWTHFFFDALKNIQKVLMGKLEVNEQKAPLTLKERQIYIFVKNNPTTKSGAIADSLGVPNPSVKRILATLVQKGLIVKQGIGPGTNYV